MVDYGGKMPELQDRLCSFVKQCEKVVLWYALFSGIACFNKSMHSFTVHYRRLCLVFTSKLSSVMDTRLKTMYKYETCAEW